VRPLPAIPVYLILAGLSTLASTMVYTVSVVYRVTIAHLNPLQLVLAGTLLEAIIFLCELPTGVLADEYGRRLSIILGTLFISTGFILEGTQPLFPTILLAQVLWGVGYSCMSGAEQAWIADEVGEGEAQQVFLTGAIASQIGAFIGTVASVAVASMRLGLPLVVAGCLMGGLGLVLLLVMPEQKFVPVMRNHPASPPLMIGTLRRCLDLIQQTPIVLPMLAIAAVDGLAIEGLDRLWEVHFLETIGLPRLGALQPVVWFGMINAIATVLSIVGVGLVRRLLRSHFSWTLPGLLLLTDSLMMVSLISFSLVNQFEWALVACWSTDLLRAIKAPLYLVWMNQTVNSPVRATVFSLSGQMAAIGQLLAGPLVGMIAYTISIPVAIATSGLLLMPVLLLYGQILRRDRQ